MKTAIPILCASLLLMADTTLAAGTTTDDPWQTCHVWPRPALNLLPVDPASAAMVIHADETEVRLDEQVTASGAVVIERPGEALRADRLTYNRAGHSVEARGAVRYDTAGLSVTGQSAFVELDARRGRLEQGEFLLYDRHARGSSRQVHMDGPGLTRIDDTTYTTCDPGNESWQFKARRLELNHDSGIGTAYGALLTFQQVPLLYLPYVNFPISDARKTGVLVPSLGSSKRGGVEFAWPIYLNLHPQLDLTLTPHIYNQRGLQWQSETRYLMPGGGSGEINLDYLPHDDIYDSTRQRIRWNHRSPLASAWVSDITYNEISDADYLTDFGASLAERSLTHLERRIHLGYQGEQLRLSALVQDYQTVDNTIPQGDRPYRRLPQLRLDTDGALAPWLRYGVAAELARFQRQDRTNGSRYDLAPSLSLPYSRDAGYITPRLALRYTRYELDDGVEVDRSLPSGSLDTGLFFERRVSDTLTQTLEPRLYYLHIPYRRQDTLPLFDTGGLSFSSAQLFQDNRFAGIDRIGDTEQLSLALTSRLTRRDNGTEAARLTLGQIHYFRDRRVTLDNSPPATRGQSDIIAEASANPDLHWRLRATLLWDTEQDTLARRNLTALYRDGSRRAAYLSYRYQAPSAQLGAIPGEEIDASLLWPVHPRWSIIGRVYHSISGEHTIEKIAGFQYESCCWSIRAVRRGVFVPDTQASQAPFGVIDYGWYVQLELKGLSNLGHRIEDMMENGILGDSNAR